MLGLSCCVCLVAFVSFSSAGASAVFSRVSFYIHLRGWYRAVVLLVQIKKALQYIIVPKTWISAASSMKTVIKNLFQRIILTRLRFLARLNSMARQAIPLVASVFNSPTLEQDLHGLLTADDPVVFLKGVSPSLVPWEHTVTHAAERKRRTRSYVKRREDGDNNKRDDREGKKGDARSSLEPADDHGIDRERPSSRRRGGRESCPSSTSSAGFVDRKEVKRSRGRGDVSEICDPEDGGDDRIDGQVSLFSSDYSYRGGHISLKDQDAYSKTVLQVGPSDLPVQFSSYLFVRPLLTNRTVTSMWGRALDRLGVPSHDLPALRLDRGLAATGKSILHTTWWQAASQLLAPGINPNKLRGRPGDRPFMVVFKGEGATDFGGPFQEFLSGLGREVMGSLLSDFSSKKRAAETEEEEDDHEHFDDKDEDKSMEAHRPAFSTCLPCPNATHAIGPHQDTVVLKPDDPPYTPEPHLYTVDAENLLGWDEGETGEKGDSEEEDPQVNKKSTSRSSSSSWRTSPPESGDTTTEAIGSDEHWEENEESEEGSYTSSRSGGDDDDDGTKQASEKRRGRTRDKVGQECVVPVGSGPHLECAEESRQRQASPLSLSPAKAEKTCSSSSSSTYHPYFMCDTSLQTRARTRHRFVPTRFSSFDPLSIVPIGGPRVSACRRPVAPSGSSSASNNSISSSLFFPSSTRQNAMGDNGMTVPALPGVGQTQTSSGFTQNASSSSSSQPISASPFQYLFTNGNRTGAGGGGGLTAPSAAAGSSGVGGVPSSIPPSLFPHPPNGSTSPLPSNPPRFVASPSSSGRSPHHQSSSSGGFVMSSFSNAPSDSLIPASTTGGGGSGRRGGAGRGEGDVSASSHPGLPSSSVHPSQTQSPGGDLPSSHHHHRTPQYHRRSPPYPQRIPPLPPTAATPPTPPSHQQRRQQNSSHNSHLPLYILPSSSTPTPDNHQGQPSPLRSRRPAEPLSEHAQQATSSPSSSSSPPPSAFSAPDQVIQNQPSIQQMIMSQSPSPSSPSNHHPSHSLVPPSSSSSSGGPQRGRGGEGPHHPRPSYLPSLPNNGTSSSSYGSHYPAAGVGGDSSVYGHSHHPGSGGGGGGGGPGGEGGGSGGSPCSSSEHRGDDFSMDRETERKVELVMYEALGRLLAMCACIGTAFNASFNPVLWKKLVGQPLQIEVRSFHTVRMCMQMCCIETDTLSP